MRVRNAHEPREIRRRGPLVRSQNPLHGRNMRAPLLRSARLGLLLVALALTSMLALGCDESRPSRRDAGADGRSSGGDQDADGLTDEQEGLRDAVDTDGDGTADGRDDDSDGDGIPDRTEAGDAEPSTLPRDSDSDGTPDFRDLDSDGNGIPDAGEITGDTDGDAIPDPADLDDDGDLVSDGRELAGAPPSDYDGDGVVDHHDRDSDGDTIQDGHEHGVDTDRDLSDDWHDADSDGDGTNDATEAGDTDLSTFPVDTDMDGVPDFRDADSDGDGVSDRVELESGTSRTLIDTDGDGVDDLVEISYGSDATDGTDSPRTHGDFVFLVSYSAPGMPPITPSPPRDTLSFSTSLRRVDIYIAIDTSGSMRGEIDNLTAGFRTTIVPEVMARIPEAQFGVGRFEDCPSAACVNGMNNLQDITADAVAVETAFRSMTTTCGGNEPYRQMLSLIATGDTAAYSGRVTPRPRRCTDPTSVGWPCFRADAVKVIVQVGDEPMSESTSCAPARSHADAVAALNAAAIRYVGIESGVATLRADMRLVGTDTGSVSAATGMPFVYTIATDGTGLSTTVVDAIEELAGNIPIRVDAIPVDDPSDAVDAVTSFIERMETNTSGATVLGRVCTAGLPVGDENADGFPDHFPRVLPGTSVCFDIVARPNQTVAPIATPQIFRATIDVIGDRFTPLDTRDVYFVVPPAIPEPGGPG